MEVEQSGCAGCGAGDLHEIMDLGGVREAGKVYHAECVPELEPDEQAVTVGYVIRPSEVWKFGE